MKKLISIWIAVVVVVLSCSAATASPFCQHQIYDNDSADDSWWICGEDFDEDGLIDLAVANTSSNSGSVTIYLNDSVTPGTFEVGPTYGVGHPAWCIDAGDLNNDGNIDLAVGCGSAVYLLWGDGNGAFDSTDSLQQESGKKHLCLADLDGDTHLDMAVSNEDSGDITIYIYRDDALSYDSFYQVGEDPGQVIAVDLDTNNTLDLVVADEQHRSTLPILWNNGEGVMDTITYQDLPAGFGFYHPWGVASLKVDDDDFEDLAVSNGGGYVAILINKHDRTFTADTGDIYDIGSESSQIIATDLDGDEDEELVVGAYDLDYFSILWNNSDSSFTDETVDDDYLKDCWAVFSANLNNDVLGKNDLAIGQIFGRNPESDLIVLLNDWNHSYRGDVNCDTEVTISDLVYLINYVLMGGPPPCDDPPGWLIRGDVDCDSDVTLTDVVFLQNYLFHQGPAPCCP